MWRQACPNIPSIPNPRGAILNFLKGVWGRGNSTLSTAIYSSEMKVKLLPALQDNYMYMIICEQSREAAIIDPVEPEKCLNALKEENVKLTHILTTHHHWDHAGGNEEMCKLVKGLTVCGGDDRIGALNKKVEDGDKLKIGNLDVTCIFTPCHTMGHICYLVEGNSNAPALFTGDTLFLGGCGRFFEGTPQQMHEALIEKLSKLPDHCNVYCGHEYTVQNLQYALHVEPENKDLIEKMEWAKGRRERNLPTIPSSLNEEKLYNPFMRTSQPAVQQHVQLTDPIEVMGAIRKEKDTFKPK